MIFGPSGTQFRLYCDRRKRRRKVSRVMEPFFKAGALEMMEKMADSFEAAFARLNKAKR